MTDRTFTFPFSDEEDDGAAEGGWITWFCRMEEHELLVEVDEEYVRDNFNLYGLKARIENYDKALKMILSSEQPDAEDFRDLDFRKVYRDARELYGLIHCRYIMSPRGLTQMREKYIKKAFGECPRVLCNGQNVLPVGLWEEPNTHGVRLYCPRCQETYEPRGPNSCRDLDGAFFGTSFPHIFLQTFPNLVPLDPPVCFVPKVFGFRIYNRKSTVFAKLEAGEYGDSLIPPQPASSSLVRTSVTTDYSLD